MFRFLGREREARHRFCRENLSAFLDGQLTAREQERIREHLEQCEACRWELQTLQRTVALLHSLPQVRAPRSFQIPRTAPAPSVPFWLRPWAYDAMRVATGVAALFLVVTLAGHALALPAPLEPARATLYAPAGKEMGQAEGPPVAAATAPAVAETFDMRTPHLETPSDRGDKGLSVAQQPTVAADGYGVGGGPLAEAAPTLSPEEVLRATAAPRGMGGGAAPTPPVAAAPGLASASVAPEPTPVPPTPTPPAPAPTATRGEDQRAAAVAAPRGPSSLFRLRLGLASYPWLWWTIGSSALLSVLAALTAWLAAVRARWP